MGFSPEKLLIEINYNEKAFYFFFNDFADQLADSSSWLRKNGRKYRSLSPLVQIIGPQPVIYAVHILPAEPIGSVFRWAEAA